MGGRGASAGGGALSPELKKVLGKKGKAKDLSYTLFNVNPNYGKGTKYSMNCQRCAPVAELVERGYNVEAGPWEGASDPLNSGEWQHMFKGQTWIGNLGSRRPQVEAKIEQLMGDWGDGARAIVYVKWSGTNSAHVFNVRQENGQTIAYDTQTRKMFPLSRNIGAAMPTKVMISRVDNLEPGDNFKYAVKQKGK